MSEPPLISVVHSFDECSRFPGQVSRLCERLNETLPSWCASGPYPLLSSRVLPLLSELSKTITNPHDSCDDSQQGLGNIFELVLSTVLEVRSIRSNYGPSRSVAPFLLSLMKILAYICANEVVIIPEATFVRARTSTPNSLAFDGIATMLACHHVKDLGTDPSSSLSKPAAIVSPASCPPEPVAALSSASALDKSYPVPSVSSVPSHGSSSSSTPASRSSQSDSSVSTSSESTSSASSSSSADSANGFFWGSPPDIVLPVVNRFFTRTLDGEDEEDDSASIDAPLDAHILPGTGRHTCAFLPFIYVADADNARDLAASIAYQRYVWGISQPAVGFVLHNSVLELVISWVDPATHSVHIASPLMNSSKEDPTVGVFDLSNPTAALSLAKFVLGLSDDVTTILTCATTGCENNSLDWRSDNLPSHDFGSCQERVNRWVHDVAICRDSPSRPSTPPSSSSATAMSSERATRSRSHIASEPKGTAAVSSQANLPKQDQTSNPSAPGSKKSKAIKTPTEGSTRQQSLGVPSQTDTKTSQNAQSCSAFAVLPAADFNQRGGNIVSWTFYRHVYDCALIKVPLHAENASEINEKIDSYNTMCGFLPPSWTKNNPPYVHPHFTARVNTLLEQVVDLQKSSASPAAFLKPKHEAIIGERLELLLSASMGAFTLLKREGQQKIPNVKEAESRHDWDAIFSRFYVDEEETISPHVLLERRIHFARNETAEMLKNTNTRSDVAAAHVKQALDYYDHCYAAQSGARDSEVIRNQAVTATTHANKLLTTITNLAKSANEFKKLVDRHSRQEPRDGICDAILFLPVRARADIISKGSFIRYTPTRATRAHAGEDTDEDTEEDAVEVTQQGTQQDNREDPQAAMELERKEILDNPFHTRREIVQNSVSGDFPVSGNHFLLPHAPVEYKKPSDNMGKPLNQGRMYLISIVAFYSALGIEDHAFYSVVTTGTFGAVIMAWKSSKNKVIYLIDRNVMTFNIAVPVEAFHFATFLLRLHEDRVALMERAEKQINKGDFDVESFNKWRKSVQNPKTKGDRRKNKMERDDNDKGKSKEKAAEK